MSGGVSERRATSKRRDLVGGPRFRVGQTGDGARSMRPQDVFPRCILGSIQARARAETARRGDKDTDLEFVGESESVKASENSPFSLGLPKSAT